MSNQNFLNQIPYGDLCTFLDQIKPRLTKMGIYDQTREFLMRYNSTQEIDIYNLRRDIVSFMSMFVDQATFSHIIFVCMVCFRYPLLSTNTADVLRKEIIIGMQNKKIANLIQPNEISNRAIILYEGFLENPILS